MAQAGKQTTFDPDVLEYAYNELVRMVNELDHNQDVQQVLSLSNLTAELSTMDDSEGGWSALEDHVTTIGNGVASVSNDIKTAAVSLETKMRTSIDTLKGADDTNSAGLTKTSTSISSTGLKPV